MVNRIKDALRIDGFESDDEILDLIESCKSDLKLSGIVKVDEKDALIIQAIKIYAKAYYGFAEQDHEKYVESYKHLKSQLCLTEEYTKAVV